VNIVFRQKLIEECLTPSVVYGHRKSVWHDTPSLRIFPPCTIIPVGLPLKYDMIFVQCDSKKTMFAVDINSQAYRDIMNNYQDKHNIILVPRWDVNCFCYYPSDIFNSPKLSTDNKLYQTNKIAHLPEIVLSKMSEYMKTITHTHSHLYSYLFDIVKSGSGKSTRYQVQNLGKVLFNKNQKKLIRNLFYPEDFIEPIKSISEYKHKMKI